MEAAGRKHVLVIDLGTSGPKAAVISLQGQVAAQAFEPVELILLPGGGAEQKPAEWWAAIVKTCRRAVAESRVAAEDIAAVCCTSQWSGTVAVDREGRALMNAVIWMDSRGSAEIRRLIRGPVRVAGYDARKLLRWIRLTGGAPGQAGKDPLAHILYIRERLPDVYSRTYKFLEPKDYINLRLTGRFAASFDSITLHWVTDNRNLARVCYDPSLIRLSTVDPEKLPELRRTNDILAPLCREAAAELGLRRDLPVVMGTPDVTSAAVGSGAVEDFAGHLYIGTSSWLTCHVPFKKIDLFHNMASLPSAIPDRYFVANEQETAGACLSFLRDSLFCRRDALAPEERPVPGFEAFDRLAEGVRPGSAGVIFTPWLYGERTPVEDHTVRSGFFNLSLQSTREHLVRAVYEGVALNGRWLLQVLERFIKRRLDPIHMIGGGANSRVWCQIHADVFDRTIRQVRDPILANARGAAFLAAVSLGMLSFRDIPRLVPIAETFEPEPGNRKTYDRLFREFVQLYKKNRAIYRRLNQEASDEAGGTV